MAHKIIENTISAKNQVRPLKFVSLRLVKIAAIAESNPVGMPKISEFA